MARLNRKEEFSKTLGLLVFVSGIFVLPLLLDFRSYVTELGGSFLVQHLIVGLCAGVWFAGLRKFRMLTAAVLLTVVSLYLLFPYLALNGQVPARATQSTGEQEPQRFRVVVANIHTENERYGEVRDAIERINPDLVAFLETNQKWIDELLRLQTELPFTVLHPRRDNFGLGVFSKLKVTEGKVVQLGPDQPPSLEVKIDVGGRIVTLVASHPVPPVTVGLYEGRNRQIETMAERMRATTGPRVLLGDFNTATWSPNFVELERVSGLSNVRRGIGVLPTWPQMLPFLYTPLDHCLVSDDFTVVDAEAVALPGSDHKALSVLVELRPGSPRAR